MKMITDSELRDWFNAEVTENWMAVGILLNKEMAEYAKLVKNPNQKLGIEVSRDLGLMLLQNNEFDPLSNKDEFRLRIGTFTGGYRVFLNMSFTKLSYNVVLL